MKILSFIPLVLLFAGCGRQSGELYAECAGVGLLVSEIEKNDAGVNKGRIETFIMAQLGFFTTERHYPYPSLSVQVRSSARTFFIDLRYRNGKDFQPTWEMKSRVSSTGYTPVMQEIKEMIEQFIDEYLEANSDACAVKKELMDIYR